MEAERPGLHEAQVHRAELPRHGELGLVHRDIVNRPVPLFGLHISGDVERVRQENRAPRYLHIDGLAGIERLHLHCVRHDEIGAENALRAAPILGNFGLHRDGAALPLAA